MNIYYEPVNVNVWNMFEKVECEGHIEWFSALNSMSIGDIVLLHVGKQNPKYISGVYGVGVIVKGPYILNTIQANNKKVVDVRIDKISYTNPFITHDECRNFINQFRAAHKIDENHYSNILEIINKINEVPLSKDTKDAILTQLCFSDEEYHEGHTITVNVNKYERNLSARNKCIEFHGSKCKICGMDFGKRYGALGEGFIHVHHLKPLHTIGKDYTVDYKNDLIPVCPNCHAMIHRINNVEYLTVNQIKEILSNAIEANL